MSKLLIASWCVALLMSAPAYADQSANYDSITRDTFRFGEFNELILSPRPGMDTHKEIPELVGGVLRRLFPAGTQLNEFDAFMKAQSLQPEVMQSNRDLHPHKRLSVKRWKSGSIVYYYNFLTIKPDELSKFLSDNRLNDHQRAGYILMAMTMHTWLITVHIDEINQIEKVTIKLDATAP